MKKRSIPVICQIIGIREDELYSIIKDGKQKNIFNENGQLTTYAKRIYLDVYKMIIKSKNYPYKDSSENETTENMYVPTRFQGVK